MWVSVASTVLSVHYDALQQSEILFAARASLNEYVTCGSSQTSSVYDSSGLLKLDVSGGKVQV